MHKIENKVLILGGNYGLLFAAFLHHRHIDFDILVSEPEAIVFNSSGFTVTSRDQLPQKVRPCGSWEAITDIVAQDEYDLAVFAMPESAFSSPNIVTICHVLLKNRTPILNLMNIPLPNFVSHTLGVVTSADRLAESYKGFSLLSLVPSSSTINSSPEPQIFKGDRLNVINLRLGGTFRCSNFREIVNPSLRERLIAPAKHRESLGISLKEYQNPWVSVSKWPMLMTGNYRCLQRGQLFSIADAVKRDLKKSKALYNEVSANMAKLGAPRSALIPFHMYLNASSQLDAPSSVARALHNGSPAVERVDRLLLDIFSSHKLSVDLLSEVVSAVEQNMQLVQRT